MPWTAIEGRKGGKGGGGSSRAAEEAPNTLQSRTTARVLDLICEGEIEGLVDGLKSVYLADTPIENEDGSLNFNGFTLHERSGTPNQEPIPGFPAVESEVPVGVQVKQDQPIVRTIESSEISAIRVKVRIPSLTEQNSENGDLRGSKVVTAIDVKPSGGNFTEVKRRRIKGKTTSPYEEAYRIDLPEGGAPWAVQTRRITDDSDKVTLQNDSYWSSYTLLIDNRLTYPDCALFGLEIDAEQFGDQVPPRGYECFLQKIQVPSNYDPWTRSYGGIWDGTFKISWTDNPAWILYALQTNERWGLGDRIPAVLNDKWTLYEIAQYCDGMVSDGFGGMEPRFTFNGWIIKQEEAFGLLAAVAQAFQGMIYWGTAGVTAVQDSPKEATRLFSPANVIDGAFNYEGQGLSARHSVALVTWWDPSDGYRQAVEVVEDPELILRYGWKPIKVVSYGNTSRGRAHRHGRWILDTEKNEGETVSFKCGLAEADLRPGEIIKIADPRYADVRYGGRLKTATLSQVILDAPIEIEADVEFDLSVVLSDGTIEERRVTNLPGSSDVMDLESPLSAVPMNGAMWALTSSKVAPRTFRVLSVSEGESHIFTVSALLYDPNKFARIEQNIHLTETSFTTLPSGVIQAPTAPSIVEYLYRAGPSLKTAITLSWTASADVRVTSYEFQHQVPGDDDFGSPRQIRGLSFDVVDVTLGEHAFRVRGVDAVGRPSPWVEKSEVVLGEAARPPDINALFREGDLAVWRYSEKPADHLGFLVRHNPGSDTKWEGAVEAHEGVFTETQFSLTNLPGGTRTLLVKAIDRTNNESEGAAVLILNLGDPLTENVIEEVDYAALGWPGTLQDGVINGGRLEAADTGDLVWTDDGAFVWSDDNADYWTANFLSMIYTTTYTPPADLLDGSLIVNVQGGATQLRVEYQPPSPTPVWTADDADVWTDDEARVWDDPPDFRPWPGSLSQPDFGEYAFRVTTPAGEGQGTIETFGVAMDVPDIEEAFDDFVIEAGGSHLPITRNYRKIKRVNITQQDDGGDARRIVIKDKNFKLGPTIEALDAVNQSTSGSADVTIQGY